MTPSPWLLESLPAIESAQALGPVVDLACGRGRNALALLERGLPVVGVDRNAGFLSELGVAAEPMAGTCRRVRADLEAPPFLPLKTGRCGVILVFRFLHRPLCQRLWDALAPGGLLVYETFTTHQRSLGYGPKSEDFLLQPDELPSLFPGAGPGDHWEGVESAGERPEAVARFRAVKVSR